MTVFFVLWLTQVGFHSQLSSTFFFTNYCHLLCFLKNHKIAMSQTFEF